MHFETTIEPGTIVITPLESRVDAHVAPALRAALLAQIDEGHRRVIVNLKRVEFIDSSGLGALVSAIKRLGREGELKLTAVNGSVRSMLELTRLNRVIPIVD